MYAGTTVTRTSGLVLGVHQRIDRAARRHLALIAPDTAFPAIKDILHFEGNNGPDGVKRKSPSVDEPWHYIDPAKPHDQSLMIMIKDHQINLAKALKQGNQERAAFEAAWLAHAIVDGLTPAHHYPLADKIEELFGMPHDERQSIKEKNIIRGNSRRDTISKNWQYWGGKGIFATHASFEFGVMTAILGKRFGAISISQHDLAAVREKGYEPVFRQLLQEVIDLGTYEQLIRKGWDWRLARTVRLKLMPLIIKAVCLGWYASIIEAEKKRP